MKIKTLTKCCLLTGCSIISNAILFKLILCGDLNFLYIVLQIGKFNISCLCVLSILDLLLVRFLKCRASFVNKYFYLVVINVAIIRLILTPYTLLSIYMTEKGEYKCIQNLLNLNII